MQPKWQIFRTDGMHNFLHQTEKLRQIYQIQICNFTYSIQIHTQFLNAANARRVTNFNMLLPPTNSEMLLPLANYEKSLWYRPSLSSPEYVIRVAIACAE